MSLVDVYSPDFFGETKARGRDCFRRGSVRITQATSRIVAADVQGTDLYSVLIKLTDEGREYTCECPYFQQHGDPCKHAWAVVLQAYSKGVLPDPKTDGQTEEADPEAQEQHYDPQEPADEPDDAWDNDGEANDSSDSKPSVRRYVPPMRSRSTESQDMSASNRQSDPNAWKRQFGRLTQVMRNNNGVIAPRAGEADVTIWPANRRILYIVDRAGTIDGRGLFLDLAYEQARRDGQWERPKQLKFDREQLGQLPDEADRQILQMLLGARSGYDYYHYESRSSHRFELPASSAETLLKLMCATGRCRLRVLPGHDPLPLAWDDGPPWEFWLEIKTSAGGRYYILEGSLRRPVEPVPLTEAHEAPVADLAETTQPDQNESSVPRLGEAPVPGQAEAPVTEVVEIPSANAISALSSADDAAPEVAIPSMERMPMSTPAFLLRSSLVFADGKVAKLQDFGAFDLIASLREGMQLAVPLNQRQELVKTLFALPRLPRLDMPPELRVAEERPVPRPRLGIRRPAIGPMNRTDDRLVGSFNFEYDGRVVDPKEPAAVVYIAGEADKAMADGEPTEGNGADLSELAAPVARGDRVIYRDLRREAECAARLYELGFRDSFDYDPAHRRAEPTLRLPPSKLPKVVAELTRDGWIVEAEGKLYRQAGEFKVHVASGIDWFELHGEVSFGDQKATLPQLLAALRRGETTVRLDDGTFGLLPQEWLKKYATLAGVGETEQDHLRFSARQVGFLDVLLSSMPEATFDASFTRARDELVNFKGIGSYDAPDGFRGILRGYQRDGLGWMSFLRRFGFGGCLADDMGLGKTVQVLALLEWRRQVRRGVIPAPQADPARPNANGQYSPDVATQPSLVVAPRSLIFNWMQEAAKFTPELRVLDHSHSARVRGAEHFQDYDVILTTYGTLRRDAGYFKDITFDYAVLDEAQAIKNSASESAKAARLVRADHRLALSGTPVQNHLGELWSLFEFLNPGMMGSASVFRDVTGKGATEPQGRQMLARAMRPFILRRTKEQVAQDLPQKMEQTLVCELEGPQRKLYNELRDHYRNSLLERVAREGMAKSKIQVLEALLRLRQAACHPGLIDKTRVDEGSAKLDSLLAQLDEVLQENHKVLVFSQFTSMLAIVRRRLDAAGTIYEYLDGKTRDRQERVDRFQTDPACKLFLISLKAGGLGLNLTAAEYVFLLDPWWNPAVEAQAIDRAHRIGQTRQVFAYRLIAKETVEEKVLQLQQTKKDLADAIINADNSLIRTLKRDDLELLLS